MTQRPPDLLEEPWAHDLFNVLRRVERMHADKPRIGDSAARRDDYVLLGQNPFLEFPASTIDAAKLGEDGRLRLFVRFLGLMGPQGALPLGTTEEAYGWLLQNDEAFARFLDLFNHRFLQLFFRAWSSSRPVGQHDRPGDDRFVAYLGSAIGLASPVLRDLDSVPDESRLAYAGLLGAKARSASRLRQMLEGLFDVRAEIDEFVGTRLAFEPDDYSRLGTRHASLGRDLVVGAAVYSVEDRFRVRLFVRDLGEYERYLPPGDRARLLTDAIFFHQGHEIDWDVELALPVAAVQPVRLGRQGRLGWTAWLSPNWSVESGSYRRDARFHLMSRLAASTPADGEGRSNHG
jgi:type VI secretion system protein ImpH